MSALTFAGKPCTYGHDGTRYVSTRACVRCALDRATLQGSRPYVRKAERAPGRRTVRASDALDLEHVMGATLSTPLHLAPSTPPHDLGESLARAMSAAGIMHVAVTHLDGTGCFQCVTLRHGYKGQVTRTGRTVSDALANALGAQRGRMDELLDVVG